MDTNIKIIIIVLVIISLSLVPSLVINMSVEAATLYCTDYNGKSTNWVNGCHQGWWDHNHCWGYSPGSGDYAKGYSTGWSKGHCK